MPLFLLRFSLVAFLILFLPHFGSAQNVKFSVKIVNMSTGLKSKTAFVNVYSDSIFEGKHLVDTNGRVTLSLETDHFYKIEACDSGKVCRYINVLLSEEKAGALMGTTIDGACQISLFPEKKGQNYDFILSNPITVFTYNSDTHQLDYDVKKVAVMIEKIDQILKEQEQE